MGKLAVNLGPESIVVGQKLAEQFVLLIFVVCLCGNVFLKNNWSVGIDLLVCYVRLESVLVKWLYVEAWGESKPIRPRY